VGVLVTFGDSTFGLVSVWIVSFSVCFLLGHGTLGHCPLAVGHVGLFVDLDDLTFVRSATFRSLEVTSVLSWTSNVNLDVFAILVGAGSFGPSHANGGFPRAS